MHDSYIIFYINSIFCLNPDQEWALESRFTLDLGVNGLVRVSKYSLEGFVLLMFVWKHGIWFECVFLVLCTQNIQSCFHTWHIQNLLVFCWLEILLTGKKATEISIYKSLLIFNSSEKLTLKIYKSERTVCIVPLCFCQIVWNREVSVECQLDFSQWC